MVYFKPEYIEVTFLNQQIYLYVDYINSIFSLPLLNLCCYIHFYLECFRYELPQPTANQKHDITSWTEAVDNSMAQLEHQAERYARLFEIQSSTISSLGVFFGHSDDFSYAEL